MGAIPSSLAAARYLNLATFRKTGAAVETPIWFAESQGRLYAFSAGNAGKVKRLRRSSQARVAICDVRGRVSGPWIDARARVITDPALIERAYRALRAKYGLQMRIANFFSTLTGRVHTRAVLEIEL
jgi:PPOX class probable F420-dependent enzyme